MNSLKTPVSYPVKNGGKGGTGGKGGRQSGGAGVRLVEGTGRRVGGTLTKRQAVPSLPCAEPRRTAT